MLPHVNIPYTSCHDFTVAMPSLRERDARSTHHWLDDDDLRDEYERAAALDYLTPRIGHERRVCWPLDELEGGAP